MEVRCKEGKLVIDDRTVQVKAPFNKTLWVIPRSAVTGIELKPGTFSDAVLFHTSGGVYTANTVAKSKAQQIVAEWSASL